MRPSWLSIVCPCAFKSNARTTVIYHVFRCHFLEFWQLPPDFQFAEYVFSCFFFFFFFFFSLFFFFFSFFFVLSLSPCLCGVWP